MRNGFRKKKEYDELLAKVQQVRGLYIPPGKWTNSQLRIMVKWLQRDGDENIPLKKQDQLTRYYETCHRGDLPAPEIPQALQHVNENPPALQQPPTTADDLQIDDLLDEGNEIDELELAQLLAGGFQCEEALRDATAVVPTAV